jgi:hypothetical protein
VKVTEDGSFIDGMWTSEARRDEILALEEYFSDNDLKGSYGILYCNAPALEAVLDLVPVMSSPWADWYTYSVDSFYEGIVKARLLSGSGEAPLIIVNRAYYEVLEGIRPEVTTGEVCIDDKYFLLIRYIWDFDYEPVFMTAEFVVYKEGE